MSVEPSRLQRDLHFDLSHLGEALRGGTYTLRAGRARYPLQPHTPETLRAAGFAPGEGATRPSHVARGVAVPPGQVRLLLVYGKPDSNGLPPLASIAIATPTDNATYGPQDIGKALVFLNPTVSVLTPKHADTVLGHIGTTDQLPGLTAAINAAGPNWCTAQPLTNDGQPVQTAGGTPAYTYVLDPGVLNSTAPVSGQSKARIYSDTSLMGARWNLKPGRSFIDMNAPKAPRRTATSSGYSIDLQDGGPSFGISVGINGLSNDGDALELDLTVTNSYVRHCAVFVSFIDINGHAITIADNPWTQLAKGAMAAVLVDYYKITEQPGGKEFLQLLSESTNTLKWCGLVSSESTFMGIPVSSTDVDFMFDLPQHDQNNNPVQVNEIRLLVGSMGVMSSGIDWDPQAAWLGLALTGFFDLAVPTYALVTGVGEESNGLFDDIFSDKGFLLSTAFSVFTVAKDLFTDSANLGNDVSSALTSLADSLVSKVLTSAEMVAKLAAWFGAEEAAEAVPVAGWALKVAALEAVVEQLAQSVGEIIGSPRVVEFDMTVTMNVQITLVPVSGGEFPATATSCLLTAQYSANTTRTYTAPIGNTKVASITIEWDQVPVGGTVNFIIAMTDPNGWGVGKGQSGSITNLINGKDQNGNPALVVQISVEQQRYPLGPDTTYLHSQLLTYGSTGGGTGYFWQPTKQAPTATVQNLGTGPTGHVLERLHGITISDDLGLLGYAWEASGLNIPPIDDDTPQTELFTMQSIGFKPLANDTSPLWPQVGYMTAPAGYSKGVRLLYLRTAQGAPGVFGTGCFFLDPSGDRTSGFHLRQVTPVTSASVPMNDPSRRFSLATGRSFGKFSVYPTSLAIHSNGYVVAVNSMYDTLQILKLSPQELPDAQAPWAFMPTGAGTGPGRLGAPTLVAIRPDQTILVLEAGNRRIQAFSCGGHPVSIAPLSAQPVFWTPLEPHAPAGTNVVYLSMSVDVVGYAYVLSYSGNGYDASDFWLDIYSPTGAHLCAQQGFVAAGLAVDLWRNAYTVNFQQMSGPSGRTEPSVSEYIPSTPKPA